MKKIGRRRAVLLLTVLLTVSILTEYSAKCSSVSGQIPDTVSAAKKKFMDPVDTRSKEMPKTTEEKDALTQKAYEMEIDTNQLDGWPKGPQTYGEGGIVMDAESGAVLYAKNPDGKAYPASITKIVTTLIALENAKLDDKVTVTQDCVDCVEYGYAHIALKAGEEISLKDALYAVLLASANEAAYAVGESVGESYEWFLEEMNRRAKELGAVNSNFLNTNGMENPEHYTTARDMALITRELLNHHPEFEEICQTFQYTIPATNLSSETRTFQQKHQMFWSEDGAYSYEVVAGKTGYTDLALNTLVTCGDDGDKRLICVVMKTHGKNVYTDTQALLDYGYQNFDKVSIAENEKSEDIERIEEGAYVVLPKGVKFQDLELELTPDKNDKKAGTAVYLYEGNPVGSAKVTFSQSYIRKGSPEIKISERKEMKNQEADTPDKKPVPGWVKWTLGGMLVMIAVLSIWIFLVSIKRKRKRKTRRRRK